MKLSKIAAGLSALVMLSAGAAQARGLMDFIKFPNAQEEKGSYRSGTINPSEALALYSSQQKQASFDGCVDLFPAGRPISVASVPPAMKPMALCSDSFAVLFSQASRTPLVVVERLDAAKVRDAKGEERTNQFYPDPRIPKSGRAELSDYRGSGFDRGHQSPAGDSSNARAMAQSFALSNMVPQSSQNNRGAWSKVEADVRKFAQRAGGSVYVFTGPIFDPGYTTIGENNVWVPTRLFKLVYDASSKRAWAYVLPNAETRVERPMDYAAFVKTTGLKLLGDLPISGTAGRS
ncbi:DNA/RNA non-specific endonuclease [Pseudomonas sp. ANT_H14]|uniref:DNA/RNA non-specific endonuclease n=1 Tax=unclassified Pseudomonas TaxID=196821 RepID=UPI0011EE9E12|nr:MULTISPECIES: DNA/RNA non-specific endonuclease [unclassified Pseudomonas]KAA0945929.1 DNA/RNA non-specific endonuclease [Pseudomonas sp. ANT_H14]KAA0946241.1 DNA/RNA non-specific endonuclease [Pseudomonas sp. ANT_H4]